MQLKPHQEKTTSTDTWALARAYREHRTGNPTIRIMLRERAQELEAQAEKQEVEEGIRCEECELYPVMEGSHICEECNEDRKDMARAIDFTNPF